MDWLWDLLDLSGLTPLGRGILVVAIIEGIVIIHLWRVGIKNFEDCKKESAELRRELQETLRKMLERALEKE